MKVNTLHLEFGYLEVKDFLKVKTMLTSHKAKIRQRLEARQRSFKYKVVLSNNFEKVVHFYKLKKVKIIASIFALFGNRSFGLPKISANFFEMGYI